MYVCDNFFYKKNIDKNRKIIKFEKQIKNKEIVQPNILPRNHHSWSFLIPYSHL